MNTPARQVEFETLADFRLQICGAFPAASPSCSPGATASPTLNTCCCSQVRGYPGRDWACIGELPSACRLTSMACDVAGFALRSSDWSSAVPDGRSRAVRGSPLTAEGERLVGDRAAPSRPRSGCSGTSSAIRLAIALRERRADRQARLVELSLGPCPKPFLRRTPPPAPGC